MKWNRMDSMLDGQSCCIERSGRCVQVESSGGLIMKGCVH